MTNTRVKALAAHRNRLKKRGLARVRVQLISLLGTRAEPGLKELLAAAPLDDIDLTRTQDPGRVVEL